jgi:hypothetical protein
MPLTYRLAGVSGAVILLFFGMYIGQNIEDTTEISDKTSLAMEKCFKETIDGLRIGDSPILLATLREGREHCYSLIRSQGLLEDFAWRKLNFLQQYRANGILLWVVVIITLSGVGLAALQLIVSYRLADVGKIESKMTSEISVTRESIVLKSSVTGLFILLLSLAFFIVFVLYVYRFEEGRDETPLTSDLLLTLPAGGLGSLPDPPSP